MLVLKDVHKTFNRGSANEKIALKGITLSVNEGDFITVIGGNGAGKSTLMKVLSGSYTSRDYDGQILIDGKPVEFTSVKVAEENGIEMVYQELNMVLEASLAENLFIGNLPGKGGRKLLIAGYKITQKFYGFN